MLRLSDLRLFKEEGAAGRLVLPPCVMRGKRGSSSNSAEYLVLPETVMKWEA